MIEIEFDDDTPEEDIVEFKKQLEKINVAEEIIKMIEEEQNVTKS